MKTIKSLLMFYLSISFHSFGCEATGGIALCIKPKPMLSYKLCEEHGVDVLNSDTVNECLDIYRYLVLDGTIDKDKYKNFVYEAVKKGFSSAKRVVYSDRGRLLDNYTKGEREKLLYESAYQCDIEAIHKVLRKEVKMNSTEVYKWKYVLLLQDVGLDKKEAIVEDLKSVTGDQNKMIELLNFLSKFSCSEGITYR
ncbi:hypothetical protein [Pseudoalteromonas rubra]|uniref:DUF1311 domain-containing protein n=1 Tax=Pseudoalteromonas rubra TaxID=43658 RepID=A0A5S3WQH4_9GAMM|nr:hypothetical protein [Pseudoalteromonas rubra]TMP29999.1 hypothetical protein CWB98_23400 [Pseudoalteromonas rubra]